jgi:hypothetical protein
MRIKKLYWNVAAISGVMGNVLEKVKYDTETGLILYRMRYYNVSLGRCTSRYT